MLALEISCVVYDPEDSARETVQGASIPLSLPREAAASASLDVDIQLGGFHLTHLYVENSVGGLRTIASGTLEEEDAPPSITYVLADGVALEGGSGAGDSDEAAGMYRADHIWSPIDALPGTLRLGLAGRMVEVDLKTGQAVLVD